MYIKIIRGDKKIHTCIPGSDSWERAVLNCVVLCARQVSVITHVLLASISVVRQLQKQPLQVHYGSLEVKLYSF